MIVKEGRKYTVKSESGKPMGSYGNRQSAEKRLKQIEWFKSRAAKRAPGRRA